MKINLIKKLRRDFLENKIINNLEERYKTNDFMLYGRTRSSIIYLKCDKWFLVCEEIKIKNMDDNYNSLICLTRILFHLSCFLLNRQLKEDLKDLEHIEWLISLKVFSEGEKKRLKEIKNNFFIKPKEIVNEKIILLKKTIKKHLIDTLKNFSFDDNDNNDINDITIIRNNDNDINEIVNSIMNILEELTHLNYISLGELVENNNLGKEKEIIEIRSGYIGKIYSLINSKLKEKNNLIDKVLREIIEREENFMKGESNYLNLFEKALDKEIEVVIGNNERITYDDMIGGFYKM